MVELVRRYSKQGDPWSDLDRLLKALDRSRVRRGEAATGAVVRFKLDQRVNPEVVDQLVSDYQSGVPTTELPARYQLSKGSVLRLLAERGVSTEYRRAMTAEQVRRAVALYTSGLTIREVASQLEVPKTTVQDALARAKASMRPAARRLSRAPQGPSAGGGSSGAAL